jgi:polyhydroxybutyrate depolymerase
MKRTIALTAGLVALALSPVGFAQLAAGQSEQAIHAAGVERSYLLHVPAAYDGSAFPLLLNYHGSGGVPQNQLAASGFDALADREGFAVAFPAGAFTNSVSQRSWNANVEAGVDDVAFARSVIADVAAKLNIDPTRIYVTGMSGGARMSSRLACELSDVLAAAAPVAGLQYPDGCTLARAIPILAFHGKADRVNQYEVSADSRPYWRMGVETAVEKWRQANGCAADMQVSVIAANVELRTWASCDAGAEIKFYVIADGGHVWPDDASERIWAFFAEHNR